MKETIDITEKFEKLFKQHYQRLSSYAYTFLKDEGSSEDIVQDIFIKIWEKQKLELDADSLKYYLFTAVRNNCITAIEKNKRNSTQELKEIDRPDDARQNSEKEPELNTQKLIALALEQLPPKCREVFMLSRLSGYTYRQIADSLNISIKTVENQMGKAIKLLRVFAKENKVYGAAFIYFLIKLIENQ